MPDWLVAAILGFIEGLTEFIPVSSTGHLLIAQHWLPRQSDLFNIIVQCGAVIAVLPLFRHRMLAMMKWRDPVNRDMLLKVSVAFFITCVGGLGLDMLNFELPEEIVPVAIALIVGGALFIAIEGWLRGRDLKNEITWSAAIVVAVCQLLAAVFPGLSRSGGTILGALAMGTNRVLATEFSFLVGIPTLLAAGVLKTYKALKVGTNEDLYFLGIATLVSAVVSFIAVKWLLRFVQSHSFVGFGIYRIVLGIGILLLPLLAR